MSSSSPATVSFDARTDHRTSPAPSVPVALKCLARRHLLPLGLMTLVLCLAIPLGLKLRLYAWHATQPVRFVGDIANGYNMGTRAADRGLVAIYRDLVERHADETLPKYGLDYPPLRLAVVEQWALWTQKKFPNLQTWKRTHPYDFTRPMLQLNTAAELLTAGGIFMLVRLWVLRGKQPGSRRRDGHEPLPATTDARPTPYAGVGVALLAALLFWFDPAVLWDAHCWPQWDVWIMPFYIFAVLLACVQWWFGAGVLLAAGALLKGQILLAAPLLVLWPLFEGHWRAALRVVIAFAFTVALLTYPWLIANETARLYLATAVAGGALLVLGIHLPRLRWTWLILSTAAAALLTWPMLQTGGDWRKYALLAAALLIVSARYLPVRAGPCLLAAIVAAASFCCVPLFNGTLAWVKVGYLYGSRKYWGMGTGGSSNLAMILAHRFGWDIDGPGGTVTIPLDWIGLATPLTIEMRNLLVVAYALCLLLSALGAALQNRRHDPRFLAAAVAPWIAFYALLPQMHDRYLVWGAGLSAVVVALGVGMTLLHLVMSVATWSMMAHMMYASNPRVDPAMLRFLKGIHPDMGWMILLIAAIFLYMALIPRRRYAWEGLGKEFV